MDNTPDILVLKFADSKVPVFKESRNKDYIKYGEDDNYPTYLNELFNKSAKHNAIINGKVNYIFGKGYSNGNVKINRLGETINDLARKCILDVETYGGYYLEIVYGAGGKIAEVYHPDYTTIRVGKEGGFYYKECWDKNDREDPEFISAFDPTNPVGSQIYFYQEYRPNLRYYPLPGYIGCNNYIETDIEISKFYLSSIKNGMMPSKMIQFYEGSNITDEKKKEIEKRWKDKFSGAENAGKFILVFNTAKEKQVDVNDLSGSELDKMFTELNKTVQQEIFSGHNVTSPMLFGIKTEGQLGGATELSTAYTIFKNTYAVPKAKAFDKSLSYILSYSYFPGEYELQPTDPIGLQVDIKDIVNSLPKAYVFKNLGIPEEMWNLPNIGSDNKPADATPAAPQQQGVMANDNIKNLTAKQHQQLMRIIRQYSKGQLTVDAAKTLLRTGLNLEENDINSLLGIQQPLAMSEQLDDVVAMFDACGENKDDFEIIKSKKVSFTSELECEGDEEIFIKEAFKTYDVTETEAKIIDLIKKDKRITSSVIAALINQSVAYVENKINELTKRGYIESAVSVVGSDEIIERTIAPDIIKPPVNIGGEPANTVKIMYSYEGPQDSRNRPICAKLLQLRRLYSRADIERISERLGYSVFDRRGGFWRHKDGEITPYCRHHWKSNIVIKKGGSK